MKTLSFDIETYSDQPLAKTGVYAVSLEELGDSFSDGTTPEQAFDAKMLDDAINRFLRALPDDARNTFIGRYYFFDSLKEVATYCGMSEAKAKSMLYRTRQSLKAYLVKESLLWARSTMI